MSAPVCTIAVIVPVHNAAKYLPDCLDAVSYTHLDVYKRQVVSHVKAAIKN